MYLSYDHLQTFKMMGIFSVDFLHKNYFWNSVGNVSGIFYCNPLNRIIPWGSSHDPSRPFYLLYLFLFLLHVFTSVTRVFPFFCHWLYSPLGP
jgi:hypothetical protein